MRFFSVLNYKLKVKLCQIMQCKLIDVKVVFVYMLFTPQVSQQPGQQGCECQHCLHSNQLLHSKALSSCLFCLHVNPSPCSVNPYIIPSHLFTTRSPCGLVMLLFNHASYESSKKWRFQKSKCWIDVGMRTSSISLLEHENISCIFQVIPFRYQYSCLT